MTMLPAGTACCARLTAIGFTPTIPVLIVDTNGQQFDLSSAKKDIKVACPIPAERLLRHVCSYSMRCGQGACRGVSPSAVLEV
jgi:hypothetical protein